MQPSAGVKTRLGLDSKTTKAAVSTAIVIVPTKTLLPNRD